VALILPTSNGVTVPTWEAVMAKPTVPEALLRALAEYARAAEAQRAERLGQLEDQELGQLSALAELLRAKCREGIERLLGPDLAAGGRLVDRLDIEHFAMLLQTEDTEAVLRLRVCRLDLSAVEQEIERRSRSGGGTGQGLLGFGLVDMAAMWLLEVSVLLD
jgi:hypothetical protein